MKKTALCLLATVCVAGTSSAALLFEDDFDAYTPGSNLAGQGGWVNFTGTGSALVSNNPAGYTAPNELSLAAGGGVRNGFAAVSLADSDLKFSFNFMAGESAAGRNLEFAIRNNTTYAFYLNLRGSRTSVDIGLNNASTQNHALSSALVSNAWYQFNATIDADTSTLTFSITPAEGGSALVTQAITLSAIQVDRIYFSSSASALSGDWSIDNVSVAAIPEAQTARLLLSAGPVLALAGWAARRRTTQR